MMSEQHKQWIAILATALVAGVIGISIGVGIGMRGGVGHAPSEDQASADADEPMYWVAPMDSNYRRDEPGLSPMGMELVPVYAHDLADDEGSIRISPAVVQNLGVRTGAVERGDLQPAVEAVAYVDYDEDSLQMVHTRVAGWVELLTVRAVGDPVVAGQVLFELYAPELVTAQEEFVAALATGNRGLITASRERLAALSLGRDEIAGVERDRRVLQRVPVTATSDGVIIELAAREGMYLQPAVHAMVISDPTALWVVAEVLERQAAAVATDQRVELTLAALPGEVLTGRVDYLYPEVDARTRSLRVRIRLDIQDARLRPNMYARARIEVEPLRDVVHIPREAVIRSGMGERVVLSEGDGRFRAVVVRAGREVGDRVVIIHGLSAGQRVVTSGQFLIDSESNLDAEVLRATEEDASPARTAVGHGTFLGWHRDGERVRIRHRPIEALGWPAMSMPFRLEARSLAEGVEQGAALEFDLEERDGSFVITRLRVIEAPPADEQDHAGDDR